MQYRINIQAVPFEIMPSQIFLVGISYAGTTYKETFWTKICEHTLHLEKLVKQKGVVIRWIRIHHWCYTLMSNAVRCKGGKYCLQLLPYFLCPDNLKKTSCGDYCGTFVYGVVAHYQHDANIYMSMEGSRRRTKVLKIGKWPTEENG